MTENEYSYLMTMFFASHYCEVMSFNEYVLRYGKKLLENKDIRSEYYGRCKVDQNNNGHL